MSTIYQLKAAEVNCSGILNHADRQHYSHLKLETEKDVEIFLQRAHNISATYIQRMEQHSYTLKIIPNSKSDLITIIEGTISDNRIIDAFSLYEVGPLDGPKPDQADLGSYLFRHKEFAAEALKIKAMGYKIVIDPSLELARKNGMWGTSASGYSSSSRKILALDPDAKWLSFIHEKSHVEMAYAKAHPELDLPIMREVEELRITTELSDYAIDETIAARRQIEALKKAGYTRLSTKYYLKRKYSLEHQLKDLTRDTGSDLSLIQKRTLRHIRAELNMLAYLHSGLALPSLILPAGLAIGIPAVIYFKKKKRLSKE